MCFTDLLTVKHDGYRGKGGAIALGLQMGFPQEGNAPVFSETEMKTNMAADPSLHPKGSALTSIARELKLLLVFSCMMSKGLLPGL